MIATTLVLFLLLISAGFQFILIQAVNQPRSLMSSKEKESSAAQSRAQKVSLTQSNNNNKIKRKALIGAQGHSGGARANADSSSTGRKLNPSSSAKNKRYMAHRGGGGANSSL